MKVAIIGSGAAGIASAYYLSRDKKGVDITLYEAADYLGGHANTIEIQDEKGLQGLDPAFVVCNSRSYPQLTKFFAEMGVATKDHAGGFNFFNRQTGLEFGSVELAWPAEKVRVHYAPEFAAMFEEAHRFFREAPRDFIRKKTDMPMSEYLARNGYSEEFKHSFVMSLATVVWSIPKELIWDMPASTLIAFFGGHDPAGLGGRSVNWQTVAGGSISYVRRAMDIVKPTVRLREPVQAVEERDDQVIVHTANEQCAYDYVIVATHADQAWKMLQHKRDGHEVLSRLRYHGTTAVLHTDASLMSPDRSRWQSWNYGTIKTDTEHHAYIVYYMNHIQGLDAARDYFLTLDYPYQIDPKHVIRELRYEHPIIDMEMRNAQKHIHSLNALGRVKFAGSYFHSKKLGPDQIASHEAAHSSGAEAAQAVIEERGVARNTSTQEAV